MGIKSTKPQSFIDYVTGGISAVIFLIINVLKWFLAYSSQILCLFGFLLLVSLIVYGIVKEPRAKRIVRVGLISCLTMVLLSFGMMLYSLWKNKAADENMRLCDYTEAAIDYNILNLQWMDVDKLKNNTIRYFIGTQTYANPEYLCKRYTTVPTNIEIVTPIYPVRGDQGVNSKTQVIVFNTEWARRGFEDQNLEPLPQSVSLTAAGILLLNKNDWDNAISVLNEALDQGNGVAGYYLYFVYNNGLGTKVNSEHSDLAIEYLKRSADLGYRRAQQEYGESLLKKKDDISISLGLQYLKTATLLNDFRYPDAMVHFHQAIDAVLGYYLGTEQYKKAYSFTKDIIKKNKLEYLKYMYHMDNCLITGHYSEALDIIQKGIKSKDPQEAGYCRVIQAKMLREGLGVNKDLGKAELALRFASDSLDYPYAKKALAEFYSSEGLEEEAAFWQRLYDIRFRNKIEQ